MTQFDQHTAIFPGSTYNPAIEIPRVRVRNFQGPHAQEKALIFGKWLASRPGRSASARQWCLDRGLDFERAQSSHINETGGFLVPEIFGNDLIDLREKFGVFRRNAKVVPMTSDSRSDLRRTGGLAIYSVGEGQPITESDKSWDRINLIAHKWAGLTYWTEELADDATISIADDLLGEFVYAFSQKEDDCGFNGTGSGATYGGMVGVCTKLKELDNTIANIAGLVVGSGNTYAELTRADFTKVVARLPEYADTDNVKWYCSRSFYYNVMVEVILGAGGVTAAEIEASRNKTFLGYPVETTQVMPKVEANSQVCCLFGDLSLAARLGSRSDIRVDITNSSGDTFSQGLIAMKVVSRFDINVHDVGNASATAALRQPGPIVGLITAAS